MNTKETFEKIAHFELKGKLQLPSYQQWFWEETINRWENQGLPNDIRVEGEYERIREYFSFDRAEYLPIDALVSGLLVPAFKEEILEEDKTHQVIRDKDGAVKKVMKEHRRESMDQWLEYPVKDQKSWKNYKKRLNPDSPARFPAWWAEEKEKYKNADYPIGVQVGSFFGWMRNWVGIENLSYLIADNPALIEEINEHVEYFILSLLEKLLIQDGIKPDFAHFWEDMAYKTGSLVSPEFVRRYMMPHYKKITEFLSSHGIDIISLDSDGNIWELIPLWLECGINWVLPNEVAAGMDVVEMRKKFGMDLILSHGIDKRILARSKKEIEEEVKTKVGTLLTDGGYFPGIDHAVPPDVPFENYLYYLEAVRRMEG